MIENFGYLSKDILKEINEECINKNKWKFGLRDTKTLYTSFPTWEQHFYNPNKKEWIQNCPKVIKNIFNQILKFIPDNYSLIRYMLNGSTYGQDPFIHIDWPNKNECLTVLVYCNQEWDTLWGGETVFFDENKEKIKHLEQIDPGKFIIYDGNIPHCNKPLHRNCNLLRTTLVIQTVEKNSFDAVYKKFQDHFKYIEDYTKDSY